MSGLNRSEPSSNIFSYLFLVPCMNLNNNNKTPKRWRENNKESVCVVLVLRERGIDPKTQLTF